MSRAALLPAGADPFLNAYWLRHYRQWANEVDELLVQVCGQDDPEIREYIQGCVDAVPHAAVVFTERIDHGAVIGQLIDRTSADLVMLCEDDAFVRRRGCVDYQFKRIESGETDVVGCPRGSASPELIQLANARFGQHQVLSGETGPALWPCFLFAKRGDLLRTDHNFGAAGWPGGREIPGLGKTVNEVAGDTFVWASFQLRLMGLRISLEPEYRAQKEKLAEWTDAPWFHVGSLSSGYGSYFLSGQDTTDHIRSIRNDLYDWNKRMSWWQRVVEKWDGALPEHHKAYQLALHDYIEQTGMDQGQVDEWKRGFQTLISWAEV
jgi:hypothetical protein